MRGQAAGLTKQAGLLLDALCSLDSNWLHPYDTGPSERLVSVLSNSLVMDGMPSRTIGGTRQRLLDAETFSRIVSGGVSLPLLDAAVADGSLPQPVDPDGKLWAVEDVVAWAQQLGVAASLRRGKCPGNTNVGEALRKWACSSGGWPNRGNTISHLTHPTNQAAARRLVGELVLQCLWGEGFTRLISVGLLQLRIDDVLLQLGLNPRVDPLITRVDGPRLSVRAALLSMGFVPQLCFGPRTARGRALYSTAPHVAWQLDAENPPATDGRRWTHSSVPVYFSRNCNPGATPVQYARLRAARTGQVTELQARM